jgi:hypothetical protein
LFNDITQKHLFERDPVLKQIAVEGVCKLLFSLKLCEQTPIPEMEAILVFLLVQLFDRTYNALNSLVRQLLSVFLKNFVLFSNQRCQLLLGAATKLVCAVFSAKYGKPVKNKARKAKAKDSDSYSDLSEDSDTQDKTTFFHICASLDSTAIASLCLALLSKEYLHENAVFKLEAEKSVDFLQRLLMLSQLSF